MEEDFLESDATNTTQKSSEDFEDYQSNELCRKFDAWEWIGRWIEFYDTSD